MRGKKLTYNYKKFQCFNKTLELGKAVEIDLNRLNESDIKIIETLKQDCKNIKRYTEYEYAPYTGIRDAFVLRIGTMGLTILVRKKENKCIVVDIALLVELSKD